MKKNILLPFILISALCISGCSHILIEDIPRTAEEKDVSSSEGEISQTTDDYILPSDKETITEIDLSRLNDTELKYAYEEIFARHGKIYEDENFAKYFNSKDWYTPDPSYSEQSLSPTELENSKYISDYISKHTETTTEAQAAQQSSNTQSSSPTVIIAHDEPYYYEHYWGDNTYIIPDSSVRKLTKSELSGFSSDALALIRNEIYARNGYVFQKEKYRDYFGSKLWYSPDPNFNESYLNETEKYNIQLIKSME